MLEWLEVRVNLEEHDDGSLTLSNALPLADYPGNLAAWLHQHAEQTPDKPFLQERAADGEWAGITYGEARRIVNRLSSGLVEQGVAASGTVAILSPNGVEMALVQLAAMQIGVPVVPISNAYSVRSETGDLVKHILDATGARTLFISDAAVHMPKIGTWLPADVDVFAFEGEHPAHWRTLWSGDGTLSPEARTRYDSVQHETLAKIQFTSGSTSLPKGVKVTHGMMASNVVGVVQTWPFLDSDEVIVDWLPWNHTFGGNLIFNLVMHLGGTLHIDHGTPTPAGIKQTAANIIDVRPTLYFGVPRSYTQLLAEMRRNEALKQAFFQRLKVIFVAAAALDQSTYDDIRALSREVRGEALPFLSAWGCTETSPNSTHVYWPSSDIRNIGLPAPGVTVKLAPDPSGKRELRVKGPNVTAGYVNGSAAFDEDGFYRTGDAGKLADPDDPSKGLLFDGRIGEDFKLTSGVWVHNAYLRGRINEIGQPYIREVVIAAPNRPYLSALIFPNVAALRARFPDLSARCPDDREFLGSDEVVALFGAILARHNAKETGSSKRIVRFALLDEPPRFDRRETTDKGYINQRAVLANYAGLVEQLYGDDPPIGVHAVTDSGRTV